MELITRFLELELFAVGKYSFKVATLILVIVIFLVTKITLWLIKKAMFRKMNLKQRKEGNVYSLFQIIKYLIWTISVGLILQTLGVEVTLLIASWPHY